MGSLRQQGTAKASHSRCALPVKIAGQHRKRASGCIVLQPGLLWASCQTTVESDELPVFTRQCRMVNRGKEAIGDFPKAADDVLTASRLDEPDRKISLPRVQ